MQEVEATLTKRKEKLCDKARSVGVVLDLDEEARIKQNLRRARTTNIGVVEAVKAKPKFDSETSSSPFRDEFLRECDLLHSKHSSNHLLPMIDNITGPSIHPFLIFPCFLR